MDSEVPKKIHATREDALALWLLIAQYQSNMSRVQFEMSRAILEHDFVRFENWLMAHGIELAEAKQ